MIDAATNHTFYGYNDDTPDVTFGYDRLGRQVSAVVVGIATNIYHYNGLELTNEIHNGVEIDHYTDQFGRPAGLSLGSDYTVDYAYDESGRFNSVSASVSLAYLAVQYDHLPGTDLIAGYTCGDFTRTVAYEPCRSLITSIENKHGNSTVSRFDYQNNALGQRIRRIDNNTITNSFDYNIKQEVIGATMGSDSYGYSYDEIGNREWATHNQSFTSYSANQLNQYTQIADPAAALSEPVHDSDGNLISDGAGWNYIWNGENRLITASNVMHSVRYAYDHRGRMIWKQISSKNVSTKTITYLWDDYNIIAESVSQDNTTSTTHNVWGLDLSGTLQSAGGVGGLVAVIQGRDGSPSCPLLPCYDANGNITEYISNDGTIVAHYEYSLFGEITAQSGALSNSFTHRFSTKPWCPITRLSEYEFRMYNQSLGRWISRDPIEEEGGLNLYKFADNNPIILIDQYGLVHWSTVARGALQTASGIMMATVGWGSIAGSGGLSTPIAYSLGTWGAASIANGINTLVKGFQEKGPPDPIQVSIVQYTYESITGNPMSPTGMNATRMAYYSIDIIMSCYSIKATWTTMNKTGTIYSRFSTKPLEAFISPHAPVGVCIQQTTTKLEFYGHVTGATSQSASVVLDYIGVWSSVYNISEDLVNIPPQGGENNE